MRRKLKFCNGSRALIAGTDSNLDGVAVVVVGIAVYDVSSNTAFYIVEKFDGALFETPKGSWRALMLTEHCLHADAHAG